MIRHAFVIDASSPREQTLVGGGPNPKGALMAGRRRTVLSRLALIGGTTVAAVAGTSIPAADSVSAACSFGTSYNSDFALTGDSDNDCGRIGVNARVIADWESFYWGWRYSNSTTVISDPPYTVVGARGCGDC